MKAIWCVLLLCLPVNAAEPPKTWRAMLPAPDKVPDYMQSISVTIRAGETTQGSGFLKTRARGGERVTFVWTAAHVVENLRSQEEVIDTSGVKRMVVKFRDAAIVREEVAKGRRVGESRLDVKVIRYSRDEDLALLEVRRPDWTTASVIFYLDPTIPPIGTRLFHVGSLLGQMGSNSMTAGIVSQIGRVIENKEFDQFTVSAFPGSSGGGVYLENGALIGMVTRGAGETFNLSVPVRRLVKWAKTAKVYWAIDDSEPLPSEADLDRLPVEDVGRAFGPQAASTPLTPSKPVQVRSLELRTRTIP